MKSIERLIVRIGTRVLGAAFWWMKQRSARLETESQNEGRER